MLSRSLGEVAGASCRVCWGSTPLGGPTTERIGLAGAWQPAAMFRLPAGGSGNFCSHMQWHLRGHGFHASRYCSRLFISTWGAAISPSQTGYELVPEAPHRQVPAVEVHLKYFAGQHSKCPR